MYIYIYIYIYILINEIKLERSYRFLQLGLPAYHRSKIL